MVCQFKRSFYLSNISLSPFTPDASLTLPPPPPPSPHHPPPSPTSSSHSHTPLTPVHSSLLSPTPTPLPSHVLSHMFRHFPLPSSCCVPSISPSLSHLLHQPPSPRIPPIPSPHSPLITQPHFPGLSQLFAPLPPSPLASPEHFPLSSSHSTFRLPLPCPVPFPQLSLTRLSLPSTFPSPLYLPLIIPAFPLPRRTRWWVTCTKPCTDARHTHT